MKLERKFIFFLSILVLTACSTSKKTNRTRSPQPVHKKKTSKESSKKPSLTTQEYIHHFQAISISEMNRTGIPASITMAQAILESGAGKSDLSHQGNNHFGIKCGPNWSGKTVYREDDDYKNGRLHKSCFRSYPRAELSYIDHSDFLTDPRKSYRYGFLFDLETNDYKSWAKGLQKAGYATNGLYSKRLISLIEKYSLEQLDRGITFVKKPQEEKSGDKIYHTVISGDTLYAIARKYGIAVSDLKKVNNMSSNTIQLGQKLLIP